MTTELRATIKSFRLADYNLDVVEEFTLVVREASPGAARELVIACIGGDCVDVKLSPPSAS